MKKVISIALFGVEHEPYAKFLPSFVLAHLNLFPVSEGWSLRVHLDQAVSGGRWGRFLRALASNVPTGVQLSYPARDAALTRAMLWRMEPVFQDGGNGFVFCRDVDAIPMPRDRACCEQFMKSGCAVGTIHDASVHVGIMGGLCQFDAVKFTSMMGLYSNEALIQAVGARDWAKKGADQDALNSLILREGGPTVLEHRYTGWHFGPGQRPPKDAGIYPSTSVWSTPVPNKGRADCLHFGELIDEADRLGAHLGCAGYDIDAALRFWKSHGDQTIVDAVADAELAMEIG